MITREMNAVIELIDLIAEKLPEADHCRQLAIVRAQLLILTRELERKTSKVASSSEKTSEASLHDASFPNVRALQLMDRYGTGSS